MRRRLRLREVMTGGASACKRAREVAHQTRVATTPKRGASKGPKAAETAPKLRSDAQQNRDGLLAAAVAAFTKDANASLEGIARTAGVGIGTLYRHYPTREALVEAAYRSDIEKLCGLAAELHAKHPPDVALARFLDGFIDHVQSKRGMIQAMRAVIAATDGLKNASLVRIAAALAPIVEAGRAQGVLRDDVTIDDFIVAKGAIATARPENARRLATILIDGLRPRERTDSPAAATRTTNEKPSARSSRSGKQRT